MSAPQSWGPSGGGAFGQPPVDRGLPVEGEPPLGKIPFSPEEERNIAQAGLFMKIAGGLAILSSLISLTGSVVVGLHQRAPLAGSACFGVLGLLTQAGLAALLFMASNAFQRMVSSDGADQAHLLQGLRQLRTYFLVKAILYVLTLLAAGICVVGAILLGAASAALLSRGV